MSTQAFNNFRAKVAADKNLQAASKTALAAGPEAFVKLGRSHGFEFSGAEAQAVMDSAELSDLELELVAGGSASGCGNQMV